MAEDLLPTILPGMVGIKEKKSGKVTAHFPVDAREILTISGKDYEMVDNGAVEAARMNANPLKALQAQSELIHSEVVGIEGQVMVAMSPEQAEAWKAKTAETAGKEVPANVETPASGTAKAEPKPASGAAKADDKK